MYIWKETSMYIWKETSMYIWKETSMYIWKETSIYIWKETSMYIWKETASPFTATVPCIRLVSCIHEIQEKRPMNYIKRDQWHPWKKTCIYRGLETASPLKTIVHCIRLAARIHEIHEKRPMTYMKRDEHLYMKRDHVAAHGHCTLHQTRCMCTWNIRKETCEMHEKRPRCRSRLLYLAPDSLYVGLSCTEWSCTIFFSIYRTHFSTYRTHFSYTERQIHT